MKSVLEDMVKKRHTRELNACKKLLSMIEESIQNAEPKKELLLVTPDAVPISMMDLLSMGEVIRPRSEMRSNIMDNFIIPEQQRAAAEAERLSAEEMQQLFHSVDSVVSAQSLQSSVGLQCTTKDFDEEEEYEDDDEEYGMFCGYLQS